MTVFSIFTLLGGLAFFIYGMNQMSHSLEKIAGAKMRNVIDKMTKNRIVGLIMGCFITIAMQSSSAVTVMLVGLVNSGIMDISNTVAVIMGSNIGTTITAWIMSLIGISSDNPFVKMLKPESFSPLLAFIGIGLIMLSKKTKNKDVGNSFVGFAILMYGMMIMSSSVAPLADSPVFSKLLVTFKNPILGMIVGLVVTAVIQSSAASVGMLQALSMAGGITYGMAIPIIMGQNIGTCVTALLSSVGANRNARRAAIVHLCFNVIGTLVWLTVFCLADGLFQFAFTAHPANQMSIAVIHSVFNVLCTLLMLPLTRALEKLAYIIVPETAAAGTATQLDERLMSSPAIAITRCRAVAGELAETAIKAIVEALPLPHKLDEAAAEEKRAQEEALNTELNDLRKRFAVAETTKKVMALGGDEAVSTKIAEYLYGAEDTESALTEIQKLWTAREKALRLEFQKIPAPSAGNADGPTITAEQFHAMGYLERVEFAQKYPEEYNKLMGR